MWTDYSADRKGHLKDVKVGRVGLQLAKSIEKQNWLRFSACKLRKTCFQLYSKKEGMSNLDALLVPQSTEW